MRAQWWVPSKDACSYDEGGVRFLPLWFVRTERMTHLDDF